MQHIHQYKSQCTGCKSKLELVLEALYTYSPIPDSYNPNLQNALYDIHIGTQRLCDTTNFIKINYILTVAHFLLQLFLGYNNNI